MSDLSIYSDEELKKIQELELDALKEIISICNEYDIEYFLIGGTALGAVRHDGFIPWDDDIDVGMTRENYNKFLDIASNKLPPNYHIQSPYNCKNNPYFYSKVRIDNTLFMEYCNRKINMHHGVYVDIFPFDEVPDNEYDNKKQFTNVQRLINLFALKQIPDISTKPYDVKGYAKCIIRKFLHICCKVIPYSYLLNKLDSEFTKFNGTGQHAMACLNFPARKVEYIRFDDLYPLITHKFETIDANVPNNSDVYLTTHYGNYMELPPEEKRFGHKPYMVKL